jgi:glycosyltransferase involved in cell wall biosynthesis
MRHLGCTTPVFLLAAGIDIEKYKLHVTPLPIAFYHIGSMEWQPNIDGLLWFIEYCWKPFIKNQASCKMILAGRKIEELAAFKEEGITIAGEVTDAISFMQQAGVMIVPLRAGGGVRIKIIEAMALGKCIISTSIGAEGIPYTANENILIADTAEEIINQMHFCVQHPAIVQQIGMAARNLAEQQFQQKQLLQKFMSQI